MFRPDPKPEKRIKPKKGLKKRYKSTGQMIVFLQIWEEREHYCQCCGRYIGAFAEAINFSHILSKGAFKRFMLRKDNIWIVCAECHQQWETGNRNQPKFEKKLIEYERLKGLYYEHSSYAKFKQSPGSQNISSQERQ